MYAYMKHEHVRRFGANAAGNPLRRGSEWSDFPEPEQEYGWQAWEIASAGKAATSSSSGGCVEYKIRSDGW